MNILEICEICGRNDRPIIKHHISYEPEKTMYVCRKECHAKAIQIQETSKKPIIIDDDVHKMIKDKIREIKYKYKVEVRLSDITNRLLKEHIKHFDPWKD